MKKIDRQEYEGRFDKGSLLGKQLDKLDELVEENSKLRMRIGRLEDIVKYHIEKK